ncbi:MAG: hypothetical protein A3F09_03450 [Chlamydiae bacterium RIFCSPHIGHO2_12_FULL_49_11]|nr:MAG: hypothetical protein A3F09_03450 [Chlamydiae bacterium RIFCSPHIGHO2_12_FULL_49_11]
MIDPKKLDKFYSTFIKDLNKSLVDEIIDVSEPLLKSLHLLDKTPADEKEIQSQFPFYFHVIETEEKVTLFNQQFVVWIIPKVIDDMPRTLTMIALQQNKSLKLELIFSTRGKFNTPKFVLRILRHYLIEVLDTEEEIASIGKSEN